MERVKVMEEIQRRNKELLEEVERLKSQIKILKSKKKYGLVWEEEKEPEQIVLDCQVKIPILKEIRPKEIISDREKSVNMLIEGDNYHALSVLNYTHKNKIDVIYIDPPYNTGKKGEWKYNDNWVDKEDTYRHSKWLSFMSKRLRLAKFLLKKEGIIFISIDDNEVSQLKLLCDEIFNENSLGIVVVKSNPRGKQQMKIPNCHEYLLVYENSPSDKPLKGLKLTDAKIKEYNKKDEKGFYREIGLRKRGAAARRIDVPNLFYPIYVNPSTGEISLEKDKLFSEKAIPVLSNGEEGRWRWSKKKFEKDKNKLIGRLVNNSRWDIFEKDYLEQNGDIKSEKTKSIWDEKDVNYENATEELKEMFGYSPFEYPKTIFLIKKILALSTSKNDLILDFFAGSGTTAHAVLELNKEDEGNRQFILCTNNENNICTDVCYPRIKKVIEGYENLKGEKVEGLGGNLKYFKTELLDIDHISHVSDEQKIKLTYHAGEMIALREGTFIDVEKNEWWQIFRNGTKYTAIYFKEDKSRLNELVEKLSKHKEKITLYIFSWGKNEYKNEFTEYKNIKVEDIPEPIIDVYKEVNRWR